MRPQYYSFRVHFVFKGNFTRKYPCAYFSGKFFTTVCGVSTCGLIYRIISRLMPIVQATKTPDTSKCTFRVKKLHQGFEFQVMHLVREKIEFGIWVLGFVSSNEN